MFSSLLDPFAVIAELLAYKWGGVLAAGRHDENSRGQLQRLSAYTGQDILRMGLNCHNAVNHVHCQGACVIIVVLCLRINETMSKLKQTF